MDDGDLATRRRRLGFRAWHRGTKEADIMLGRFVDQHADAFDTDQLVWFEALLMENDVDIMAWIIGTKPVPEAYDTPLMHAMQTLEHMPDKPV